MWSWWFRGDAQTWNPLLDGWHPSQSSPPDEEAPGPMWLLGFSVSQSAVTREAPEGSWNDPRVGSAPPSFPGGRCLKKQQKLTSGKIWPQVWFPKNHSIHLIWFYFSWPFLTNQISRFQLSGSLSNIKCLLAEIEVDSTFPFLLLNQLNCWLKKQHPWKWSLQHFNIF